MKKFLLILIIFSSFLSLFFSCDDSTGPPHYNAKINLTLEDVSCTEVWLKLQVDNPALKIEKLADRRNDVIIYRDNLEIKRINNIPGNDTIIFDEGLLPNKEYTYQAKKIISESEFIESEEIKAQTMDTTSHNFTFETYTFGEYSSSVLYDVAIIDENNIWAVGEIYMNDSLGNPDPIFYNAIHWDGSDWELKRIFYKGGIWTIRTIFAFNENDIWFSGYVRYYNGHFIELPIPDILMGWSINKLWGTSSNDLYAVGDFGNIAHYQNGRWSKIESGTDVDLIDVWGSPDGNLVWIVGFDDSYGSVLLRKTSNNFEKVLEITNPNIPHLKDKITHIFKSLWTNNIEKVYLGAIGRIYIVPKNTTGYARENIWWEYENKKEFPPETNIIRGLAANDVLIAGYNQFVRHWNGLSWKRYEELEGEGNWYSIAVNKNFIIVVGEYFSNQVSAKIAMSKR